MTRRVRMRHPDLPGAEITVPDFGVPFRRAAGWVVAEDPPEAAAPDKTAPDKTPRRRRTSEKE